MDDWEELSKTIKSIQNQKFKLWEHIIVNASITKSDNKLVNDYFNDKKVTVINKKKCSIAEGYNTGIKKVRTRFFQIINAGTTFYDNETLLRFINDDIKSSLCFFSSNIIINNKDNYIVNNSRSLLPFGAQHESILYSNNKIMHLTDFSIEADIDFILKHLIQSDNNFLVISEILINYPRGGYSDIRGVTLTRLKNILVISVKCIKAGYLRASFNFFLRFFKDLLLFLPNSIKYAFKK